MAETKNKPIKSYRLGNVEASVWPNKSPKDGSIYFSFNFQKSYKNKDGEWVQTGFFSRGDLADLAVLAMKLCMEETEPRKRAQKGQTSPAQEDVQDDVPF